MKECNLCPRRCNALRTDISNIDGFCQMPSLPRVARASLHFWEEPCISGTKGSGTIFFSGCNLKCVYCQNFEISHGGFGKTVSYERLADIMRELEAAGAHNINFVTPAHYIDAIENALRIYRPHIPLVYNSSGYDVESVVERNIFDIYLFDLKYFNNEKAVKYSAAPGYFERASRVIKHAYDIVGGCVFSMDGIMQKGIIIRHLLLPSSTNDAIGIINWAADNCPGAIFSLMSQYLPCGDANKFKELNRKITKREYEKVVDFLTKKEFYDVYIQELSSSDTSYIPNFDLEGV